MAGVIHHVVPSIDPKGEEAAAHIAVYRQEAALARSGVRMYLSKAFLRDWPGPGTPFSPHAP